MNNKIRIIGCYLLSGCLTQAQPNEGIAEPELETITAAPLVTDSSQKEAVEVAESAKTPLNLPETGEEVVRLQIFLDQKHFGPGFIDGKAGTFTRLAIENYNTSLGREVDHPGLLEECRREVPQVYATAVVPEFVHDFVDSSLPWEKPLQAERKAMSYRSVAEFMAERYHTSEDLLVELNGSAAVWGAKPKDAIQVPNVEPFMIENMARGRSHTKDEHLSARHVVVDTKVRQVYIYELILPQVQEQNVETSLIDDQGPTVKLTHAKPRLVASFPITPGQTHFIPRGFWNLKNCVELPTWRYDQLLLDTGVRGTEALTIPPGPNNPVGVIWNGLTKSGIGIHGTDLPRTIGRTTSAGCIRLANWDAARFPTLVRPGAIVVVR
ncbi:MAG: L,D-transpeptidase family protein [Akkermansiaceae bacterium]